MNDFWKVIDDKIRAMSFGDGVSLGIMAVAVAMIFIGTTRWPIATGILPFIVVMVVGVLTYD